MRRTNNSFLNSTKLWHCIAVVFIFMIILSCSNQDTDTLDSDQVNSQLFSAASYKARECGDPIPSRFLFAISDDIPQRNVDLCTFAILRTECPFDGFPVVCVLIYLDEAGEIPPAINFGDFINDKL